MSANIIPTSSTDGITYANAVPLTTNEAVLGDGIQVATIVPVDFGQAISAVIQLSANGIIVGNSTYVILQMDMGNGVWVDLNWLFWNQTQGTATFVFSNGIAGATTFQQSRNSGQVPLTSAGVQGNGTNQLTLGGRIRFVGKTIMTSGSSSAPGVTTAVTATIHYRLLGLR